MNRPTYGLLIAGDIVTTPGQLAVLDPATEEIFATCSTAGEAELESAVSAARRSQPAWEALPHAERQEVLVRIAERIHLHREELSRTLVREQGKTLAEAMQELAGAEHFMRSFARLERAPRVLIETPAQRIEEHPRALGIVAGIVPWNFPLMIAAYKIGPAILAGNAIIVKPAPTTPLTTLRFGELIRDLVPPGIVQVLVDDGPLGPLIAAHPAISKVSFTGSTATGRSIMAAASSTLKRLTLELGGNDAAILLDDVDLDRVLPWIQALSFANAGQVCVAIKRLYVPDAIYDQVCARLSKAADAMVLGNGLTSGVQMGPLQNRRQFESILRLIDEVRGEGATVIAGGARMGDRGYFIRPTVVRDCKDSSRLVREEAFGPIRPVLRYSDLDEVVARANECRYGLGASVWSSDVERAAAVGARLQAGTVWINQHMTTTPDAPFGGWKDSGLGVEFGPEALDGYSMHQVIHRPRPRAPDET